MVIAVEISENFLCKNANLTFLEESGWLPNTGAMAHVEVIVDMCMQSTWRTFFIPFPKPYYHACWREGFNIARVKKDTYICSLPFVGGKGPTADHPDPIPATATDKWIQQQLADSMYQQHSCCCVNIQQLDTNWITTLHASTNIMLLLLKDAFEFCPCESLEVWLDAWLVTYSYLLCLSLLAALISDRHPL